MAVLVAQSQGHITKGTLLTKIGSFRSKREYATNVRERALIHLTWLIISKLIAFFKKTRPPSMPKSANLYRAPQLGSVFGSVFYLQQQQQHQGVRVPLECYPCFKGRFEKYYRQGKREKNLIRTLKRNAQLTILIERSPNSYLTCFFVCANNV